MSKLFAVFALCFGLVTLTSAIPSQLMRILNGAEAAKGQFPYLVSIRANEKHWCGGTIISSRHILAAAHCVGYEKDGKFILNDIKEYTIRAGSTDQLSGGVIVKVAEFFVREDYTHIYNDLSILRLETPLIFSDTIKSIALDAKEAPAGTALTVAGWGRVAATGNLSPKLLYATAVIMSRKACQDLTGLTSPNIYCLARPVNNGSCNGDSGGPAVYGGKLVGVAGFVFGGSCGTKYPDGYTKVSVYLDWINNHLKA